MRIIFFGTPDFAVPTLDALVSAGHELLSVVAQPDKPKGRGQRIAIPPTVVRARHLGIPTQQPRNLRGRRFAQWMEESGADAGLLAAYGHILTPRVLAAPRLGCINVHPSLLPRYRGAAPYQWALIRGETEVGVSTIRMDEGEDTGDLLLSARTPVDPDETAGELVARLATIGAALAVQTLSRIEEIEPARQDDALHTLAPLLCKADGEMDWSKSALELHNHVRGLHPWPVAWTRLRGERLRIHRARPHAMAVDGTPGTVIEARRRLLVATGEGALEIVTAQRPSRALLRAVDLVNGTRLAVGERLG